VGRGYDTVSVRVAAAALTNASRAVKVNESVPRNVLAGVYVTVPRDELNDESVP